jgi:hypothetical protein
MLFYPEANRPQGKPDLEKDNTQSSAKIAVDF